MKKLIICAAGSTIIAGIIILMITMCKKCTDEIELELDDMTFCVDQTK